jgi:hypothetical protein
LVLALAAAHLPAAQALAQAPQPLLVQVLPAVLLAEGTVP